MTKQNHQKHEMNETEASSELISFTISRRETLKALMAATGATALSTLPNLWETPLVEVGSLPAHAQISPVSYPFTSELVGLDPIDALLAIDRGWLVFNINNGVPSPLAGLGSSNVSSQAIPSSRPFPSVSPSWAFNETLTISYVFISSSGAIPEDGTVIWLYGVSEDGQFAGAISEVVSNGKVAFSYPIPSSFTGKFYLSADFFDDYITLTDGTSINSTFDVIDITNRFM